jgi:hypothetical protein
MVVTIDIQNTSGIKKQMALDLTGGVVPRETNILNDLM